MGLHPSQRMELSEGTVNYMKFLRARFSEAVHRKDIPHAATSRLRLRDHQKAKAASDGGNRQVARYLQVRGHRSKL